MSRTAGSASGGGQSAAIAIRDMGSFAAGAQIVTVKDRPVRMVRVARNGPERALDLNGDYVTGQCYVHYTRLEAPSADTPVMFWHGGAMTGVTWETTPDGRPGWQMFFLRSGYDVYVCDAMERGRAGWSPYPEIYSDAPIFRTQDEAWTLFRMGPAGSYQADVSPRRAYAGQQFPVEAFDRLGNQFVPRWTDHGAETLRAYGEALHAVGPVFLIAHSQGANFALEAAQTFPELIKGVVAVEPASAPDFDEERLARAASIPHLIVWGDFIDKDPLWARYRAVVDGYVERLRTLGNRIDVLDLPKQNITGNSHVPMMDKNSNEIAALVDGWLQAL